MNQHVLSVHDGKKPFKCDICSYSFDIKGNMNEYTVVNVVVHVTIVTTPVLKSWMYRCSRKSRVKLHFAPVHEGNKPFKCDMYVYSCSKIHNFFPNESLFGTA